MDDQQWNWFLTPSTTPTDATFSPTALKTPGTSTHFQDAFYSYNQHPQQPPSTSYAAQGFDNHNYGHENAQSSFHHLQQPQQSFHDQNHSFGITNGQDQGIPLDQDAAFNNFVESFQVQTPPPTRDQSAKRRAQRTQSVVFGTPSSMTTRTQGTEHAPLPSHTSGPQSRGLPTTMSQPILSQFAQQVPPTAPMSDAQNHFFWQSSGPHQQPQSQPQNQQQYTTNSLDDPFDFQPALVMHAPVPQHTAPAPNHHHQQRPQSSHQPHASSSFTSQHPQRPVTSSQMVPNMMTTDAGVNPTILYSSPHRFAQNTLDQTSASFIQTSSYAPILSPEKRSQVSFAQPSSIIRPPSRQQQAKPNLQPRQESTLRPGLRRSNTTGTTGNARPVSLYGSIDSLSRSNTTANVQRRASPLKRMNRNSMHSLSSISEAPKTLPRSRTSVVLTVDSQGRARTETRLLDPSPTKSLKSRYPSLWDDSDDDSDSDGSTQVASQNTSFSASRMSERSSKVARLDPPLENLEGLHLPRSHSSASMRATPSKAAYAAAMQLRRQGSVKKPSHSVSHSRRNTMASFNGSFADSTIQDDGTDDDMAHGDAGIALRRAMERRTPAQQDASTARPIARSRAQSSTQRASAAFPPRTTSLLPSHNLSLDSAPILSHSQPTSQHPSPARSSPIKPTGDLADTMATFTRCICHLPLTDGQLMIQCNACQLWSHTACLGLHPQNLPHNYICHFCASASGNAVLGPPMQERLNWEAGMVAH